MFVSPGGNPSAGFYSPGSHHNNGANILFAGGHVLHTPATKYIPVYPATPWTPFVDRIQ